MWQGELGDLSASRRLRSGLSRSHTGTVTHNWNQRNTQAIEQNTFYHRRTIVRPPRFCFFSLTWFWVLELFLGVLWSSFGSNSVLCLLLVCSMSQRPVLQDPAVPAVLSQRGPTESSSQEDECENVGTAPKKHLSFFFENEKQWTHSVCSVISNPKKIKLFQFWILCSWILSAIVFQPMKTFEDWGSLTSLV